MGEPAYKSLIAWQKADQLAKKVYLVSKSFPAEEIYGITPQLRRAALSIPTNIVEGYARRSSKELKRFLLIALGSLAEVEYLLDFSVSMKLIANEDYKFLYGLRCDTGSLLWKFYISI